MPPKALELETPVAPDPNAPPVTELAGGSPPPAKAGAKAKAPPDTAGVDQFLKAQLGSDRYKEVMPGAGAAADGGKPEGDGKTPERGPDGKFLKPGAKPAPKAGEKKPEAKPAAAKPKAPAAKPAPFKPQAKPAAPALTQEQIVAAASEGAARALAAGKQPKDGEGAPAAGPKEPELPPEEQDKVEILTKMEALYPAKYKGIADKYKKSLTALETYAKAWEKEHPGQPFDDQSPEHEEFFKENDVDWSDLDFQRAIARLVAEDVTKDSTAKTKEELAELKRAETLREKQGEIAAEQNVAALHFWQQLGDEFCEVLKPDGTLNMEKANELKDSDPEAWSIRVAAAQALDLEVSEIYKLFNGLTNNDPEKNAVHRNINRFAVLKEQELVHKDTQYKLNAEGQIFVPAAQYYDMNKADQAQHWTFSARDLAFLRAADLAGATEKRVEQAEEAHRRWAKAHGIQLEDPDAKPESPSAGGEPRMAAVGGEGAKSENNAGQNFLQKQLHG